jgi:hypothetical protein
MKLSSYVLILSLSFFTISLSLTANSDSEAETPKGKIHKIAKKKPDSRRSPKGDSSLRKALDELRAFYNTSPSKMDDDFLDGLAECEDRLTPKK